MAGGNNTIKIQIEDLTGGSKGSGGASGGSALRLEQAATALTEVAKKMDSLLSGRFVGGQARDPAQEQARKLELINANQQSELLRREKKFQQDKERLEKNEETQRNIIREKALADQNLYRMKEEKAQKDHARRMEIKNSEDERRNRNKYMALSAALATGIAAAGKSIGSATANYSLSNSLIRPDLAYSQLVSSVGGTGLNLLSGGLILGGAQLGGMIGGIPGALIGGVGGGLAAGLSQFAGLNLLAGYQLNNAANYAGQMSQYDFGGSYAGLDPNFLKSAISLPGIKENFPQLLSSFYGSVGNSGALSAALAGTSGFAELTGSQSMLPAIAATLPGIIKTSGMGGSSSSVSSLLSELIKDQRQFGGDTVANLQAISTLLQSSSVNTLSGAASLAYGSQLLNPALTQGSLAYASALPTDQFTQNILAKAITGYSMNDITGINGMGAQAKAIAGIQAKFGSGFRPGSQGTLSSSRILAQVGLGSMLYPVLDSKVGNLGFLSPDVKAAAISQAYSAIGTNPSSASLDKLIQNLDPTTREAVSASKASAGAYNAAAQQYAVINAEVVQLSGTIANMNEAGNARAAGYANTFHKMIHGDNS